MMKETTTNGHIQLPGKFLLYDMNLTIVLSIKSNAGNNDAVL